jgi:hypothetical protein
MLGTLVLGNTKFYGLVDRRVEPLRALLAPLPESLGQPWAERFALAASLLSAEQRTRGKSSTTQAVEVRKVLESRRKSLARSSIALPPLATGDPWPHVIDWMTPMLQP